MQASVFNGQTLSRQGIFSQLLAITGTKFSFIAPVRFISVGPTGTTVGVLYNAARCIVPESFATKALARLKKQASSSRLVFPQRSITETPDFSDISVAVDEINADGGINGYQVEFNFQDDEADAQKSVNAYNTLKDWGMQILEGTVTSGACIAVSAETNADRIFQLTPSASSTDVTTDHDNTFQVCFSDPNQGTVSAEYIAENNLYAK